MIIKLKSTIFTHLGWGWSWLDRHWLKVFQLFRESTRFYFQFALLMCAKVRWGWEKLWWKFAQMIMTFSYWKSVSIGEELENGAPNVAITLAYSIDNTMEILLPPCAHLATHYGSYSVWHIKKRGSPMISHFVRDYCRPLRLRMINERKINFEKTQLHCLSNEAYAIAANKNWLFNYHTQKSYLSMNLIQCLQHRITI